MRSDGHVIDIGDPTTFFFPVLLMGLMGVVFGQENAFTMNLQIVDQDGSRPRSW